MPTAVVVRPPLAPDPTWPYLRLDTEGAWAFLLGALKELGARYSIEAISTVTHGCAGVLMASGGPAVVGGGGAA